MIGLGAVNNLMLCGDLRQCFGVKYALHGLCPSSALLCCVLNLNKISRHLSFCGCLFYLLQDTASARTVNTPSDWEHMRQVVQKRTDLVPSRL